MRTAAEEKAIRDAAFEAEYGYKDYRDEFPEVVPVVRYGLENYTRLPKKAQGFPDVWEGREGQIWFPELRYTASPEFVYETLQEAIAASRKAIAKEQANIDARVATLEALANSES